MLKKFNPLVVLTIIICLATGCSGCGKDKAATGRGGAIAMQREAVSFSSVTISANCDVVFTQDDVAEISVEGGEPAADKVITLFDGDNLIIKTNKKRSDPLSDDDVSDIKVRISSANLKSVVLRGSGSFTAEGPMSTDTLDISLSGSGSISFNKLTCDSANVALKGGGDIVIDSVRCAEVAFSLMGGGDINAGVEKAAHTSIRLLGTGDVHVNFSECGTAECQIVGSGNVVLSGHLENLDYNKTGNGTINTGKLSIGDYSPGLP